MVFALAFNPIIISDLYDFVFLRTAEEKIIPTLKEGRPVSFAKYFVKIIFLFLLLIFMWKYFF